MSGVIMNKSLLLFLLLGTSGVYANTTYLDCNVRGSILSSFENKNLRDSKVTVEINEDGRGYLSIIIDGEDDYIVSAGTMKYPNIQFMNLSNDSKYDLTIVDNRPRGNIVSSTNKISINRLSGHLSVSKAKDFKNNIFVNISYSGSCKKVTGKKF
jgi:hypothetical protein